MWNTAPKITKSGFSTALRKIKQETGEYKAGDYRPINAWREDERPREKLIDKGSHTLSDSELLAILLGGGTVGRSAVDLARDLLSNENNISSLSKMTPGDYQKIKGIGLAKAAVLAAAFEISKRVATSPFENKAVFKSPEDVVYYYIPRMRDETVEKFRVILLSTSNRILREKVISTGILNSSLVHPREVFKTAISENAASLILLHNHPSGNAEPSHEDKAVTRQIVSAGEVVGIKVLDHIIIAGNDYYSFAGEGLI
jgi:DNA repair protein RadC